MHEGQPIKNSNSVLRNNLKDQWFIGISSSFLLNIQIITSWEWLYKFFIALHKYQEKGG